MESLTLWASIFIAIIGLVVIAGIIWFAYILSNLQNEKRFWNHPIMNEFFHNLLNRGTPYDDFSRYISEIYTEHLQRRNELWTAFGQVLLAVLIVIVLSILLLTKTISAEAGLPILSGISGFAIAKGIAVGKSMSIPQDRQRMG